MTYTTDAHARAEEHSLNWRKSSLCPNNATCVEVAALPDGGKAMRDGKNPTGPHLAFGTAAWVEFLVAARAGEFTSGV